MIPPETRREILRRMAWRMPAAVLIALALLLFSSWGARKFEHFFKHSDISGTAQSR